MLSKLKKPIKSTIKILVSITVVVVLFNSCKNIGSSNDATNKDILHLEKKDTIISTDIVIEAKNTQKKIFEYSVEKKGDGYWQRGTYYKSKIPGERFFHIRANIKNEFPEFYFIGTLVPKDSTDVNLYAKIYELNKNKELFVIDSIPVLASESKWIINDENIYFEEFVLRHYDNLILENKKLYYYKENKKPEWDEILKSDRDYYVYKLNSKKKPELIHHFEIPETIQKRMMLSTEERAILNPKMSMLAYTDTYEIILSYIDDRKSELDSLRSYDNSNIYYYKKNEANGDFNLTDVFSFDVDPEDPCPEEALFGAMCWNSSGKTLYFDNSGECYACIWMIDVESKEVTKIVPEHEAIHPYYFQYLNQEYIAYVYKNKIQLSQP